jgi:hypothetical protein
VALSHVLTVYSTWIDMLPDSPNYCSMTGYGTNGTFTFHWSRQPGESDSRMALGELPTSGVYSEVEQAHSTPQLCCHSVQPVLPQSTLPQKCSADNLLARCVKLCLV